LTNPIGIYIKVIKLYTATYTVFASSAERQRQKEKRKDKKSIRLKIIHYKA